ncbi:hypothetical protein LX32DRAFT_692997 [Colletotrichum zoysiae]|uniref:Uncharacterized protein n=1 Tax=Colletotrichum zoysiae TaxID=1216348 RepID=A0AAD9HJ35_9PEZI|nr:hypothetical protein LX32DRAFT_692997 [Colletotrichum zoysiae]
MKSFLLPLALFIATAQAQLILGALALIEFTIEILEAEAVVATIEASAEVAITGAEAAETATLEATITNAGTTLTRVGEGAVELEGDASLVGLGRVATQGPGYVQGTFTYGGPFPLGVGAGRNAITNPQLSLNWGARTNAIRSGGQTRIEFSKPDVSNFKLTNPGAKGTTIRFKGQPSTQLLAPQ